MISVRVQKNVATAKQYFREHLATGEYYTEGSRVSGRWFGQGAERLGLQPGTPVDQTAYERLCDNRNPVTGEKLTARQRQVDRRVCYDFVVSAPKSVSIMALTAGDGRLVAAHEAAAEVAMGELEKQAAARVRAGRVNATRGTGEVVAARFTHTSSRALDPQLHTHFVVLNASYDPAENRWKALQTERMFEKLTLFTEIYRSELARRALALGYRIRPSEHGFELEHVSDEIIQRFSKRRQTILAEEAKLTGKLGGPISNNARATLAHTSRDAKVEGLSEDELQRFQRAQLSAEELESLRVPEPGRPEAVAPAATKLRMESHASPGSAPSPEEAKDAEAAKSAIDYARDHLFERRSVVPEWMLLREGLHHARSKASYAGLVSELAAREEFIRVDGDLTTAEMLGLEGRMITLVNRGMETEAPLNTGFSPSLALNPDQAAAVRHLMHSPDWVVGLRGGAGTGKSTLLREVARGIEAHQAVVPLAPTSAAVIELRKSGFPAAATVQRFLADSEFQRTAKGRVLMVDEAGLLSTRNMLALLETAKAHGCRVLLSGDTRQHASVDAGDALRLLERKSALSCARVDRIVRQVREEYREAIAAFAAGDGPQGLLQLRRLGAVREIGDEERYRELATAYRASVEAGKSTLVVSPTWREIEQVTAAVRSQLKACGQLGAEDTELLTYRSLKWTQAQKRDLSQYRESYGLHFHRPTECIAAGETLVVRRVHPEAIEAERANGEVVRLTRKQAGCFDVAEPVALPVATGEVLLLGANDKKRGLYNGQRAEVRRVNPDRSITLLDGRTIPPSFRTFTAGYCVTSHASQGRTVDHVFVAVDSRTLQAAHLNQFYVSCSRGREQVRVYTDSVEFLEETVRRRAERLSATELVERASLDQNIRPARRTSIAV